MAHKIEWSESALARMEVLFDFVARRSRRAAVRIIHDLFDRIEVLGRQPRLGAILPGGGEPELRQMFFGKYRVIYRVEAGRRRVRIVAVQHVREAPIARGELEE